MKFNIGEIIIMLIFVYIGIVFVLKSTIIYTILGMVLISVAIAIGGKIIKELGED